MKLLRQIYCKLRGVLSPKKQGQATKFIFQFSRKPYVKVQEKPNLKRFPADFQAGLILSADFELGWAFRYSKTNPNPERMAGQSRLNFPLLLDIFEDYSIPVTWATVGHLFLEGCSRGDHDWMKRIPHFENKNWRFLEGDWFSHDPYSIWSDAKAWYAPDLIKRILDSKVEHEIGCHSFSHIDFSYENCPPEVAEDEIEACVSAAGKWGIELKSMVFPGGAFGNIEVLKKYGFSSYRRNMNFDLSYPYRDELGLLVTSASSGLGSNPYGWSKEYFLKRYKKYIEKAIKTNTVCHFWFHPSLDDTFLKGIFPPLLKFISEKREAGILWIGTMMELSDYIKNTSLV